MQQFMQTLLMMNPQVRSIMNELKTSGMTAEELFYKRAKEMGVDPDTILGNIPDQFKSTLQSNNINNTRKENHNG